MSGEDYDGPRGCLQRRPHPVPNEPWLVFDVYR